MQLNKWRVLALAIAAATVQHAFASEEVTSLAPVMEDSSQAKSNGFVEDSTLHLESRNVAFYKNYKNTDPGTQNYINEWGQAELLTFTSGYSQGVIGFGVDAFANGAVRLNGGGGTGGRAIPLSCARHPAGEGSIPWATSF